MTVAPLGVSQKVFTHSLCSCSSISSTDMMSFCGFYSPAGFGSGELLKFRPKKETLLPSFFFELFPFPFFLVLTCAVNSERTISSWQLRSVRLAAWIVFWFVLTITFVLIFFIRVDFVVLMIFNGTVTALNLLGCVFFVVAFFLSTDLFCVVLLVDLSRVGSLEGFF